VRPAEGCQVLGRLPDLCTISSNSGAEAESRRKDPSNLIELGPEPRGTLRCSIPAVADEAFQ